MARLNERDYNDNSKYLKLIQDGSPIEFVDVMRAKDSLMKLWHKPADDPKFWVMAERYYHATIAHRTICPSSGGEVFDYVERELKELGKI